MKASFKKCYQPYFRVSGKRKELLKSSDGSLVYGGEMPPRVRFECLGLKAAEAFATEVFRNEDIICEIHEITQVQDQGAS